MLRQYWAKNTGNIKKIRFQKAVSLKVHFKINGLSFASKNDNIHKVNVCLSRRTAYIHAILKVPDFCEHVWSQSSNCCCYAFYQQPCETQKSPLSNITVKAFGIWMILFDLPCIYYPIKNQCLHSLTCSGCSLRQRISSSVLQTWAYSTKGSWIFLAIETACRSNGG